MLSPARTAWVLAILATAGGSRQARADEPELADARLAQPIPLVLNTGVVITRATIESGVAPWAPLSVAPDLWVGASDRLTLGATSSEEARGWVGAGRGLCLRACAARYGGAAADARFRLTRGDVEVAGRAALDFRGFGPGVVALELGVAIRSRAGAMTVTIAPYVSLGIVNAELDNHVQAVVPLALRWDLGRVALGVRSGVRGDVDGFFATAQIPLGGSIDVEVARGVAVGAGVGLPRALGADRGLGERVGELHVEWRP